MPHGFAYSSAHTACSSGSTSGLAATGTAAKAFFLAHPMGIGVAGGVLIGAGAYWALAKMLAKEAAEEIAKEAVKDMAEADEASKPA